jgi:type 1 glutamine amidotransferase
MRLTARGSIAIAVMTVLLAAFGSTSASAQGVPDHAGRFDALIFTKTAAFRHTDCIREGTAAIQDLADHRGFNADHTEDAGAFTDANLANYDVVIFLCTTGNVLDEEQQAAFERFIQGGGGYAGIHSASDTEYDWPWYGGLVGAYFLDHPFAPQFQVATMHVEDRHTAATNGLGDTWVREEEWYNFRSNPRDAGVHVLLTVDEDTYNPSGYTGSTGMGDDHPISWCHSYDGGRAFYTALGHKGDYWSERKLLAHVLGGIEMAAGAKQWRCD